MKRSAPSVRRHSRACGNPDVSANDSPATTHGALPITAVCPLCARQGAPRLFFSRDRIHNVPGTFGVYRCPDCHAVFIQPLLSDTELAKYYPEEYGRYRYSRSLDKKNYRGWQRFVLEYYYDYPPANGHHSTSFKRAAAFLLSLATAKGVLPYRGTGKILDVGCGGGSYLYRLKQWGWETYGVEPSETGAKQAKSLGLAVHHGSLEKARFPDSFFDAVRLSNVLEHLSDPKATLQQVSRILKPEGLVYITVPNTRSFVFWLFQDNWYALDSPRHVICYCPRTLQFLCDATGFEIADISFKAGPFNFVRSVKYYFEEKGRRWPSWFREIQWERSKFIRRALKPFFFAVDSLGYGDFLHATLQKKTN